MPTLPNPELVNRKSIQPGGVSGLLRGTKFSDVGADTSIADTLLKIGDEGYEYAMKEKARLDQVAVDDAKNQYMQSSLELKKEANEIKGKDAVDRDLDKEYTTKLDSLSENISSGLKNDTQRNAWSSYYGTAKTKFRASVMQHKINESDKYSKDVSDASISNNQENAIVNAHNDREILESEFAIKEAVAKELVRTGNDKDPEITAYNMNEALSPMWFGVIKKRIEAGQYQSASELLDEKRDVLGKSHGVLLNLMETERLDEKVQSNRDELMELPTWEGRLNKAREKYSGEEETKTVDALKKLKNEESVLIADEKRRQSEHDIGWMADNGIDLLSSGSLTINDVESAGLSEQNEMLWKEKVYEQDEQMAKKASKALSDMSKNTYADLAVKISLNPEKYTEEDLAKFVGPNTGGINASQFMTLRDDLKKAKDAKTGSGTTSAKQESRGSTLLKSMYDRGDFGTVETGKDKFDTESWKIFSDVLVDYKQLFRDDPEGDHRQWLDNRIQEEGEKILAKRLDEDWKFWPFGDESVEITKEFLEERGIEQTPENVKKWLGKTPEGTERKPKKSAKSTKKVKAKLMKREDGTHYILFPNGTTKEATVDKDGKVSF